MGLNKNIELNDDFKRALSLMEESAKNVFVTGKAGTGKSTLLEYFCAHTGKNVVVLAPTGVAALNVHGQTIHSFFRFKLGLTPDKIKKVKGKQAELYRGLETIIIDEISMARADLLDLVDKFLRLNGPQKYQPFGGVQMIFIGDLYQLPPVVSGQEKSIFTSRYRSPYFFDADIFGDGFSMEFVELEKIYRQKDNEFIRVLNRIRNNSAGEPELAVLNSRVGAEFPGAGKYHVQLTTTNKMAAEINQEYLGRLKAREFVSQAQIDGDFDERSYPTEPVLRLKSGSQVMFLNNDSLGRWVNGTIGKLEKIEESGPNGCFSKVMVKMENGFIEEVEPHTWEIIKYKIDKDTACLTSETAGSFIQYPLKLAWAVTIHKSQGKTFERVVIDIGKGSFAHGQTYVALSRCRSLEGISLKKPLQKSHILLDWRVVDFVTKYQYGISERDMPSERKKKMIEKAIEEKRTVEISYLKTNDEKSRRRIQPLEIGKMEYQGRDFMGVRAFCHSRGQERVFHLERILDMRLA